MSVKTCKDYDKESCTYKCMIRHLFFRVGTISSNSHMCCDGCIFSDNCRHACSTWRKLKDSHLEYPDTEA